MRIKAAILVMIALLLGGGVWVIFHQAGKDASLRQEQQELNRQVVDLQQKRAHNKKLIEKRKKALRKFYEQRYQEDFAYRKKRYGENNAFMEKIARDPALTPEQKKGAIKARFDAQIEKDKERRRQQQAQFKAQLLKMKSEIK